MPRIFATALLFLACLPLAAQSPIIDRIDPPDWFTGLTGPAASPTLLIHGDHLTGATFTLAGSRSAHILRSHVSANGHYAFLTLALASTPATTTLHLTARTSAGAAAADYRLTPHHAQPTGFSPADTIYLIMPDRFADGDRSNDFPATLNRADPHAYHGGDLQGILDHLDYLQQLGVTALWLTPIVQNDPHARDYHGYGATDLYAVDTRLGSLATYQALADQLHRRHMKLIFDDVPNHVGPAHPWVADPPAPGWFHGTAASHLDNQYVFPPVTSPHAAPAASLNALDGWFANILPDLNQDNPLVATYLTQNMIWWIEHTGIDALRIDTFPYVQRTFWQSYLGQLTALYPHLTQVGEVENGNPTIVSYFAGGRTLAGLDTHLTTPFDYPAYYKLMDVLAHGQPLTQLDDTLRQDWLYPHPELLVPFLGNHDQPRFLTEAKLSQPTLRLATGLLLTLRGTPQLYYGDEVLITGNNDPDNRHDFPGGFPGDPANAFTAAGRTPAQNAMHDWTASLLALRARIPALHGLNLQTVLSTPTTYAFVRTAAPSTQPGPACPAAGSVLVALNRDPHPATLPIPLPETTLAACHTATPLFGDATIPATASGSAFTLPLPAWGFAVYTLQ